MQEGSEAHPMRIFKLDAELGNRVLAGRLCQLINGQPQSLYDLIGDEHGTQRISLVWPHRDAENTCQVQKGNVRVGLEQLAVALAAQRLQDNILQNVLPGHLRKNGKILETS